MVFFGIVSSFVLLSYVSLPVFLVVFQAFIALWLVLGMWFMLCHWWVMPLLQSSWTPSPKLPDIRGPAPTENSAIGCAKVLAGREMDRLSYAFSDDDEYAEIQASMRARR
jgi:hypothetical protein